MAFVAYRTWVAAETVDEDHMNEQIRDNGNYLKTAADTHDDCVMRDGTTVAYASPAGTRVKTTVYQNTSGKTRLVTISAYGAAAGDEVVYHVGAANPPTIHVGNMTVDTVTSTMGYMCSFYVPNSYYYEAKETNATITIVSWIEWDIL